MQRNQHEVWSERNFRFVNRDPHPTPISKERVTNTHYIIGALSIAVLLLGVLYA